MHLLFSKPIKPPSSLRCNKQIAYHVLHVRVKVLGNMKMHVQEHNKDNDNYSVLYFATEHWKFGWHIQKKTSIKYI